MSKAQSGSIVEQFSNQVTNASNEPKGERYDIPEKVHTNKDGTIALIPKEMEEWGYVEFQYYEHEPNSIQQGEITDNNGKTKVHRFTFDFEKGWKPGHTFIDSKHIETIERIAGKNIEDLKVLTSKFMHQSNALIVELEGYDYNITVAPYLSHNSHFHY